MIIPAKNEAVGIASIVEQARVYAEEVIVVAADMVDRTAEISRQAGAVVFEDRGCGKGAALRIGIENATRDILVFADADGSHLFADISDLVEPIIANRADLVVASRIKGGSDDFHLDFDNLVRQVGSQIVTYLTNRRFGVELTDILNGFRAIRRELALQLPLTFRDFEVEPEMVIACLKKGMRVAEIASHESARQWGESKLNTAKGWRILYRILKELAT